MSTSTPTPVGIAARDALLLGRELHDFRGYVETQYVGVIPDTGAVRDIDFESFPDETLHDLVRGIRYHVGRITELHPEDGEFAKVGAKVMSTADEIVTLLREGWDGEPRAAARRRAAELHTATDGLDQPGIMGDLLSRSPFGPAGWAAYDAFMEAVDANLPGGEGERTFFRLGRCLQQMVRPWVSVWANAPAGSSPYSASHLRYELLPQVRRLLDEAGAAVGLHFPRVPVDQFVPNVHLQPLIDAVLDRLPEGLLAVTPPSGPGAAADGTDLPSPVSKMAPERRRALLEYARKLDPKGRLAGESDRWLEALGQVWGMGENTTKSVLLTGERGTGKSELAEAIGRTRHLLPKLAHSPDAPADSSSQKQSGKQKQSGTNGGGGDGTSPARGKKAAGQKGAVNMDSKGHGDDITPGFYRYTAARSSATDAVGPRAEWVGYAPHSGYSGVDPKGVQGLLERYKGGTILVDEFADLSEEIQTLLLDVAEGKAVVPVGIKGKAFVPDVRLVFATNKDVQTHIRPDLLDRIAVRIALPPLRERTGDVFLVVSQRLGETNYRLDFRTWELFLRFDWPGNVRQLRTVVGNAVDRARTEGPDDRTSANRSGVTKPRKGRVVLPFGYFTADGLLAAVVARVSPDEDTAKRVVQKWLSDLLRGWGYKPRARSSRRSDTKGKQRSVPVPVKSLAKRMGELLDVMELNETVIREVKSLAKRMGELLGVSESTISRGRRGSADHPPAGASPPAEG